MIPEYKKDYEDNNRQSMLENILFPVRNINEKRLQERVENKTILITGASYGIGAALVPILAEYTVTLLLVARTEERLATLKKSIDDNACNVKIYAADLRDENEISNLLELWKNENINVDIIINNAGKSIYRKLWNSLDRFHDTQRCAATNYTGPVQLILGVLNGLLQKEAHIINVSAINVLLPPAVGWSAYQSSKVAFDQWLKCSEAELKAENISVSSIYLPLVRTRMSMVNENKHGQPAMSKEKAAKLITNYIINRKRRYTPWWFGVVRLSAFIFPGTLYRIQLRQIKKADK
ncbi:MAG: SDR family NAD(P)-dependent oxidoreductase [Chitinophagaceae bacterium]|nr:SDR family NAD(P)-dependent oxidoreductase [Chitinophagaceae bacterium]MBP6478701.1 SDR family NAD(P)-dependent oxidoreductase [Chitinophagaceae bacterium]MBP7107979.1 SDR family NAD(P)-dependent oxidoreductase [Chitinophagaceae bacterium]MBP7314719.1 SDR family NAD(P)-dependent oxidoreductase [Chitinophagaceae bacterium]HQX95538.1 SDR family NAD(P)-dependent oxidoreductase [Chitinophagaceae bacterium]